MNAVVRRAIAGSADSPLRIGEIEIPCYVLDDGTRVLTQRGITKAFGRTWGSAGGGGNGSKRPRETGMLLDYNEMTVADKGIEYLPAFLRSKSVVPFLSNDLTTAGTTAIPFAMPRGGRAIGFPAELLSDACNAWIDAFEAGALRPNQYATAEAAKTIARGLQKVGVIALVDEATGYQQQRPPTALQDHLAEWFAAKRRSWTKQFPDEFTREFGRLYGVSPIPGAATPLWVGSMIRRVIYDRMAPGLGKELSARAVRDEYGSAKHRLHQELSDDVGLAELRAHIAKVTALMQVSPDRNTFIKHLNRVLPVQKYQGDEDRGNDDAEPDPPTLTTI